MRCRRYIPVALAVAVLAAAGARAAFSSHAAVSPTMHAFVHEDASIGLTFDDGTPVGSQAPTLLGTLIGRVNPAGKLSLSYGGVSVAKVKAGRYKITVADKTPARSFVVQQKGRAATTISGVSFVGTHSVTLVLSAGQWSFFSS